MRLRKTKSRSKKEILKEDPFCIYCGERSTTVDHMPPKKMFIRKWRLSGMEFGSCFRCNEGAAAADAVASFLARMGIHGGSEAIDDLINTMKAKAPAVLKEIVQSISGSQAIFGRANEYLYQPLRYGRLDGSAVRAHMSVFGARFGMALFRQLVRRPLCRDGVVYARWNLNCGILEEFLNGLPLAGTLEQGKHDASDQFEYQYNTDRKYIAASFARFQRGLYIFSIAADKPEYIEAIKRYPVIETDSNMPSARTAVRLQPSELCSRIDRMLADQASARAI
ncbi:MAG: hypothetical protein FWD73_14125 [Polyangiaceae bacterium]|nr:hypothetical protein [Polyangiaceae bacterium]